ncbi:hypothetical protein OG711_38600 (plasmid) [Streptomyces uncialis]|uniref:hypothetical protein n=1 Tax=Streptomyces uncialis TaxID=1048205 RepID=UPI002E32C340|nr:hypothetical protein [Streptomyces uncialis]
MSVRKTPEILAALRKEAEEITRTLADATDSETDVARVLELVKAAEDHLELVDEFYYPNEGNQVHLDLAAALAALAKAGARAIALRLDHADPRE